MGLELGSTGVDRLERHRRSGGHPGRANLLCRHVTTEEMGQLRVRESETLHAAPLAAVEVVDGDPERHLEVEGHPGVGDLGHLGQEPRVDPGRIVELLDRHPPAQQRLDLVDPFGGGRDHVLEQLGDRYGVDCSLGRVAVQSAAALFERADRLLQGLGERPSDTHDLADGLHAGAELVGGSRKLLEGPTWDLGDYVVDDRLERCRGGPGDVVGDLVEPVAHGKAGGDLGDREPGGLGGQRGRSGHTRVHLDDCLVTGRRVHGKLHVGPSGLHSDPADARKRGVAHLLVLDIGQRLGRCHRDGVAGVHAHRVEVLDGADHHAVVGVVPHDLELVLFLTGDGPLDEHLADRRGVEPFGGQPDQGLWILGDAGSGATEDVARAHHDRIPDRGPDGHGFVQ